MPVTSNADECIRAVSGVQKELQTGLRFTCKRAAEHARDEVRDQIPPPRGAGRFPGYAATGRLRGNVVSNDPTRTSGGWQASVYVKDDAVTNKYARIHNVGGIIVPRTKPYLVFQIQGHWVRTKKVIIRPKHYMELGFQRAQRTIGERVRETFNSFLSRQFRAGGKG